MADRAPTPLPAAPVHASTSVGDIASADASAVAQALGEGHDLDTIRNEVAPGEQPAEAVPMPSPAVPFPVTASREPSDVIALGAAESIVKAAPAATPHTHAGKAPAGRNTVYVVGFWRRLLAGLVDLAAIIPVACVAIFIAGRIGNVHFPTGTDFWLDLLLATDPALVMALLITVAVAFLYVLVFQIVHQRTLGMRVLRMKVIDVWGDPPSAARCFARCGGYIVSVLTVFLGFLWIGFDAEKRGLHDWLSGTYVVKE